MPADSLIRCPGCSRVPGALVQGRSSSATAAAN